MKRVKKNGRVCNMSQVVWKNSFLFLGDTVSNSREGVRGQMGTGGEGREKRERGGRHIPRAMPTEIFFRLENGFLNTNYCSALVLRRCSRVPILLVMSWRGYCGVVTEGAARHAALLACRNAVLRFPSCFSYLTFVFVGGKEFRAIGDPLCNRRALRGWIRRSGREKCSHVFVFPFFFFPSFPAVSCPREDLPCIEDLTLPVGLRGCRLCRCDIDTLF